MGGVGGVVQESVRPRGGELVVGELLLAVGAPEGSEVRPCPDEWRPAPRRAEAGRVAREDVPLDREADLAQVLGLLAEGRCVRLTGKAGSGRSTLLAAVAGAAGELTRDGVVRLDGHRRTAGDLLQELFAATHRAPGLRPGREELPRLLAGLAAVVVIDDVEPAGPELEELLATAPGCVFAVAAAPGSAALPPGSRLTDHAVGGLARPACLALTAKLARRPLDAAEKAWAVDLWFESEGLPLRFVQAAALLRQRDVAVDSLVAAQEERTSVFGLVKPVEVPDDPAVLEAELRRTLPLPSVAETAAPAARLAEGLSEPAQAVLRLALALGGQCPTAPHLPALIEVDQGQSALQELADCGLAVPAGGHLRLVAGVTEELAPHWAPEESAAGAAQHFAWWVGHASVGVGQVAAEAEVVVGVLRADRAAGRWEAVLRLARAAGPALALAMRWGAWEHALQLGLEAARELGSEADEAWFRHEAGVLALCLRQPERAVADLTAALALRSGTGETRAVAALRRMLALAQEREPAAAPAPAGGRRPVIRAMAQGSWRYGRGAVLNRKTVLAGAAAVVALGVLGTAVGLSLAGPAQGGAVPVRPGDSAEPVPGGYPGLTPSASASSAAPAPSASDSASESPTQDPGDGGATASHRPKPSESSTDPGTTQPPVQPPVPVPTPKPTRTTPKPSTPPPTTGTPTADPSPTDSTSPSGSPSGSPTA
ncbi:ATP-binding protein [Kitasatospora sp. NPDC002227]|uniref:ATP-binding protein n=1 Tax=Kitasatospora sp. NPDC002227 TaxID=3154773 RepID=UPI00332AA972